MGFTEEEIREFKTEVGELLDTAENCLLALEKGAELTSQYDEIFRDFHSIKGAAGMMELKDLQGHMHQAENTFSELKGKTSISKSDIEYFLRSIDIARRVLAGEKVTQPKKNANPAPAEAPKPAIQPTLAAVPAPSPTSQPSPLTVLEKVGKLLLVDDEQAILEVEKTILESAGFEVEITTNPNDVIQLVERFSPDTVVTDITMPQKNGVQLLEEIHARWPDLPVIFVSGHVDKDRLMEAIGLGVFGVIEKPFMPHRIIEDCLHAVRRSQITQLFEKTLNLLMYQYSDLETYLAQQGKEDIKNTMRKELDNLLKQRRLLRGQVTKRKQVS